MESEFTKLTNPVKLKYNRITRSFRLSSENDISRSVWNVHKRNKRRYLYSHLVNAIYILIYYLHSRDFLQRLKMIVKSIRENARSASSYVSFSRCKYSNRFLLYFFREKKKSIKIHEDMKSVDFPRLTWKVFWKNAQIRWCQSVIFRCVAERRSVRSYFIFGKTHFRAGDDINYYD